MAAQKDTIGIILARGVAGALKPLIFGITLYLCTGQVSEAFKAYAGQNSNADLNLNLLFSVLANGTFSASLTIAATASGWAFGIFQMILRRRAIKRIQQRNVDLERTIDSRRTSSGLRPDGKTREEDRWPSTN